MLKFCLCFRFFEKKITICGISAAGFDPPKTWNAEKATPNRRCPTCFVRLLAEDRPADLAAPTHGRHMIQRDALLRLAYVVFYRFMILSLSFRISSPYFFLREFRIPLYIG